MILLPRPEVRRVIPGIISLADVIKELPANKLVIRSKQILRNPIDQHYTPKWCIEALLQHYHTPGGNLLEPASVIWNLISVLAPHHKSKGQVFASDISDHRKYGDFLSPSYLWNERKFTCIITNPPFSLARQFVNKAFTMLDPHWGGDVI